MGRPTKFSVEVVDRLCAAIRLGATYELACAAAGISYDTLNAWQNGKGGIPATAFRQFLDALKKAEGEAVVRALERINQATEDGHWQTAAWLLERRYPNHYGRRPPAPAADDSEREPRKLIIRVIDHLPDTEAA
jgi:transposase